jgi:sulfatase modifying factor 1
MAKPESTPVAKPAPKPEPTLAVKPAPTTAASTTPAASAAEAGGVSVSTGVEASPPPGRDPPREPWATAQGKDAFGHWAIITIHGLQQRLRWLPPGSCVVGSPADEPGHNPDNEKQSTVTFTYGTWMADTECTEALWLAVTQRPGTQRDPRLPAINLSVAEAIAFTHALRPLLGGAKARLPSRAEWERACRAGTNTAYATGNDVVSLKGYANLFDLDRSRIDLNGKHLDFSDGFIDLAPVASLRPNRWGFFDMHGNIAEYCLSLWHSLPPTCTDPLTDDEPSAQRGFIRGGAYDTEGPIVCRAAALPYIGAEARNADVGFRFLIESAH